MKYVSEIFGKEISQVELKVNRMLTLKVKRRNFPIENKVIFVKHGNHVSVFFKNVSSSPSYLYQMYWRMNFNIFRFRDFIFFHIFSHIFIRYFLHLHFKCYPKSPLHPPPNPAPLPTHSHLRISISNTHIAVQDICNSSSRVSKTTFWPPGASHTIHIYTLQPNTRTHKIKTF